MIFQRWLDVKWILSKCERLFFWQSVWLASSTRLKFRTIHAVNQLTNDPIKASRSTSFQTTPMARHRWEAIAFMIMHEWVWLVERYVQSCFHTRAVSGFCTLRSNETVDHDGGSWIDWWMSAVSHWQRSFQTGPWSVSVRFTYDLLWKVMGSAGGFCVLLSSQQRRWFLFSLSFQHASLCPCRSVCSFRHHPRALGCRSSLCLFG